MLRYTVAIELYNIILNMLHSGLFEEITLAVYITIALTLETLITPS